MRPDRARAAQPAGVRLKNERTTRQKIETGRKKKEEGSPSSPGRNPEQKGDKMKKIVCGMMLVAALLCANVVYAAETAKQPVQTEKVEGPGIKFEKTVHDYGTIEQGANGDCEFVFTNNGTEPLILSNVRSSCGCTIPSWPREPIMPGKSSAIKVHYDTNRIGGIAKSITVSTNGTPERIVLSIRGTVTPKK